MTKSDRIECALEQEVLSNAHAIGIIRKTYGYNPHARDKIKEAREITIWNIFRIIQAKA